MNEEAASASEERAAESARLAAQAALHAAASAERASLLLQEVVSGPLQVPPSTRRTGDLPTNPWNRFQQRRSGRGWTVEK